MESIAIASAALLGAASFAVIFRTPRRYLLHTIAIGCCSLIGMRLCPKTWHVGFSTFLVALLVASLSHAFARATRAPAQCFLIPGVIFLVPGTYVYRSFSAALSGSMHEAGALGLAAATITIGVSFGILLANWVVPPRKML